ncbi:TRAP transporter small permease [Anaeroselena agilis]|uniref:TRAP transporter small permease n=1 Tax=Anaeroselena agilis TaxID=3063788 RepID=A0ABU3NXX9_9FIRM|nr:TRAP transporter small permease [Selenomonadales bacterium 4137-cl]
MSKLFDAIEDWFLAITLGAMLLLNFGNVLSRYFLNLSMSFTEEITTNLFVWSCFFGAAAAAKRGAHLGLSLFTDMLSAKWQRVCALFVTLLALIMFAVIIWTSIGMVQSQIASKQTTPALGIPEWTMGIAVPVGAAFCFVRFAQAGWLAWRKGGN